MAEQTPKNKNAQHFDNCNQRDILSGNAHPQPGSLPVRRWSIGLDGRGGESPHDRGNPPACPAMYLCACCGVKIAPQLCLQGQLPWDPHSMWRVSIGPAEGNPRSTGGNPLRHRAGRVLIENLVLPDLFRGEDPAALPPFAGGRAALPPTHCRGD